MPLAPKCQPANPPIPQPKSPASPGCPPTHTTARTASPSTTRPLPTTPPHPQATLSDTDWTALHWDIWHVDSSALVRNQRSANALCSGV